MQVRMTRNDFNALLGAGLVSLVVPPTPTIAQGEKPAPDKEQKIELSRYDQVRNFFSVTVALRMHIHALDSQVDKMERTDKALYSEARNTFLDRISLEEGAVIKQMITAREKMLSGQESQKLDDAIKEATKGLTNALNNFIKFEQRLSVRFLPDMGRADPQKKLEVSAPKDSPISIVYEHSFERMVRLWLQSEGYDKKLFGMLSSWIDKQGADSSSPVDVFAVSIFGRRSESESHWEVRVKEKSATQPGRIPTEMLAKNLLQVEMRIALMKGIIAEGDRLTKGKPDKDWDEKKKSFEEKLGEFEKEIKKSIESELRAEPDKERPSYKVVSAASSGLFSEFLDLKIELSKLKAK